MLLNYVKGPTYYEDIRTVNEILYPLFRDAWYVMGYLTMIKNMLMEFWRQAFGLQDIIYANYLQSYSLSTVFEDQSMFGIKPGMLFQKTFSINSEEFLEYMVRKFSFR